MSSALAAFQNPDRQAPLMPHSMNNCPSAPFQSFIQVSSTPIKQNVSIQENLNVAISENDCDLQQQAHGMISRGNFTLGLFLQFQFEVNCNCLHGPTSRH